MAVLNLGYCKTGTSVTSSSSAIPQAQVLARHQRCRRLRRGQSITDNEPPFRFDRVLSAGLRGPHGPRRPAHPSRSLLERPAQRRQGGRAPGLRPGQGGRFKAVQPLVILACDMTSAPAVPTGNGDRR